MATFTVYCDCINYPSICLMQSLGELGNLSLKWGLAGNRQGEILAPHLLWLAHMESGCGCRMHPKLGPIRMTCSIFVCKDKGRDMECGPPP